MTLGTLHQFLSSSCFISRFERIFNFSIACFCQSGQRALKATVTQVFMTFNVSFPALWAFLWARDTILVWGALWPEAFGACESPTRHTELAVLILAKDVLKAAFTPVWVLHLQHAIFALILALFQLGKLTVRTLL